MLRENRKANRLADERSPYLLQHAQNPVDWYPWGPEAFRVAKEKDRPVFLSVGYSACHWCHVMARESFENQEVADVLNRDFVSVKVDREERPDVDNVYMRVCQMLTGGGGWPLTVILTPEGRPFWAATYLPPLAKRGFTGLLDVLRVVAEGWKTDKEALCAQAERVMEALRQGEGMGPTAGDSCVAKDASDLLGEAYKRYRESWDHDLGGIRGAPKFPSPSNLHFLLRYWRRTGQREAFDMVERTLHAMYAGGIYDHVGYGFCRYSTDARWLLPHFEKMLYDNALLLLAFVEMAQATQKNSYKDVVREIVSFLRSDLLDEHGAFYSAIDADSEGEEGKFYLWTPSRVKEALGEEDAEVFRARYGISGRPHLDGGYVPNLLDVLSSSGADEVLPPRSSAVERLRKKALQHRGGRVRPLVDDKILASWNAMAAVALGRAAWVLDDQDYLKMAKDCVGFILSHMVVGGKIHTRYRDGDLAAGGFLDDYAYLIWALIELYGATFDRSYLQRAKGLAEQMVELFWDGEQKVFYMNQLSRDPLVSRALETMDGAVPAGNSVATMVLLKLSRIMDEPQFGRVAEAALAAAAGGMAKSPTAYGFMLSALDYHAGGAQELTLIGERDHPTVEMMVNYARGLYLPTTVVLLDEEPRERPEAVVCKGAVCGAPLYDVGELQKALLPRFR